MDLRDIAKYKKGVNNLKSIISKSSFVDMILGSQKVNNELIYRLLNFCSTVIYDDNVILYNNMTRELLELTSEEYNMLTGSISYSPELDYYINNWFLVPVDNDDKALQNNLRNVTQLLKKSDYIRHFIILTTTDCNARCFYCYENGIDKFNMTDETAIDVAEFILKKSKGHKVRLEWFGGEPLFNINPINIITDILSKNNCNFKSTMITNGYLFDKALIDTARNKWKLEGVQITLDGTEAVYNRCKNYIYTDCDSPYIHVINNISDLIENGISVNVRLNMDKHNVKNLYELIDELYSKFNGNKNITVDVCPLFDGIENKTFRSDEDYSDIMNDLFLLEDYIAAKGMLKIHQLSSQIKTYACMANNPKMVLITPNGKIGKCDRVVDDKFIGDIYSDEYNTAVVNGWAKLRQPVELCDKCENYPNCVVAAQCPSIEKRPCNMTMQKDYVRMLHRSIISTYENSLTKN